jgi:hypothetical protein
VSRCVVKEQAAGLLAGRLTLLQAVARFRDVGRSTCWSAAAERCDWPRGRRPPCRIVMDRVTGWCGNQLTASDRRGRTLEAELEHRTDGTVHLPD